MHSMRFGLLGLGFGLLLACGAMSGTATAADGTTANRAATTEVLTTHPATYALATMLTDNTQIKVSSATPMKLPASRMQSYFSGRGQKRLEQAATRADAIITMGSIWPQDPSYPHARRFNIRIVEIDAGSPLDQELPGIAMMSADNDPALYQSFELEPMPANGEQSSPWLSPTALGRMADVLASDLARLAPAQEQQIEANLAHFRQALLKLKADADMALVEPESLVTLALGPHFGYLASDLGLDMVGTLTAASREWQGERLSTLTHFIREEDVVVVLIEQRLATEEMIKAIKAGGAKAVVLDNFSGESGSLLQATGANLQALTAAY